MISEWIFFYSFVCNFPLLAIRFLDIEMTRKKRNPTTTAATTTTNNNNKIL
jgi:hypothetical protein